MGSTHRACVSFRVALATVVVITGLADAGRAHAQAVDAEAQQALGNGPTVKLRRLTDGSGDSLVAAGDVDGDGVTDFLWGDSSANAGALERAGLVRLVSGASGKTMRTWSGGSERARFGLVVGAPETTRATGQQPLAWVSSADGDTEIPGVVDAIGVSGRLYRLLGSSRLDAFGAALAAIPDLDGDGVADLAIGVPARARPGAGPGLGVVELRSGSTGSPIQEIAGAAGEGEFGVWVGATRRTDAAASCHGVCIVGRSLTTGWFVVCVSPVSEAVLWKCELDWIGAQAPRASVLGDWTGDGVSELAIGLWRRGAFGSGAVLIVSGADGVVLRRYESAAMAFEYGSVVVNTGDWDGDGVADLVTGSMGNALNAEKNLLELVGSAHGLRSDLFRDFDGELRLSSGIQRTPIEPERPLLVVAGANGLRVLELSAPR